MQVVNLFLLGGIAMASLLAGLFFFKFWSKTHDRLFLLFGLSFLLEGINRVALAFSGDPREGEPFFYLVRLLSFALILFAVLDKNLNQK